MLTSSSLLISISQLFFKQRQATKSITGTHFFFFFCLSLALFLKLRFKIIYVCKYTLNAGGRIWDRVHIFQKHMKLCKLFTFYLSLWVFLCLASLPRHLIIQSIQDCFETWLLQYILIVHEDLQSNFKKLLIEPGEIKGRNTHQLQLTEKNIS